jgi:hypothetical protein
MLLGQPAFSEQLVPSEIVRGFDVLEIESIDRNILVALDTLHDSGTQKWVSSSNQASGHIKILRSYEFEFSRCREIEIMSKQVGFTDKRIVSFCVGDDFYWHRLSFKLKNSQ